MPADISTVYLRIYFSLHNTFWKFQAELAMPSVLLSSLSLFYSRTLLAINFISFSVQALRYPQLQSIQI